MGGPLGERLDQLDVEVAFLFDDGTFDPEATSLIDSLVKPQHGVAYEQPARWRYLLPRATQIADSPTRTLTNSYSETTAFLRTASDVGTSASIASGCRPCRSIRARPVRGERRAGWLGAGSTDSAPPRTCRVPPRLRRGARSRTSCRIPRGCAPRCGRPLRR